MVTATRRSTFSKTEDSVASSPTRRSPAANGKRKSISSTPEIQDSHASKRRKRPQVEVIINTDTVNSKGSSPDPTKTRRFQVLDHVEIMSPRGSQPSTREPSRVPSEELAQDNTPSTKRKPKKQTKYNKPAKTAKPAKPESNLKSTHMRFGSEEPAPIVEEEKQAEKAEEDPQDDQEESDDDDAPEAVSNVTQLQQFKGEERKREQAKQQLEQKEKEKRREHARRLQSQAASKPRRMSPPALPTAQLQKQKHDEIMSESSATLQGSEMKATSPSTLKASLPMLLPDDILNAEPTPRPPTPPREKLNFAVNASSNKIRFLDTVQKTPKDVRIGNTSVRVLDEMTQFNSRTGANNRLAPKASKASKNVKDRWISGQRNKNVSGLRRTTGGTSGFVRK